MRGERGIQLTRAPLAVAASWARRGVVPCRLREDQGWSIITPVGPAEAPEPYHDALRHLAARPVAQRMRPAAGFFLFGETAVVTSHGAGWRAVTRWLLRRADGVVKGDKNLAPLRPSDLTPLASVGPAGRVTAALTDHFYREDLTSRAWLTALLDELRLPGALAFGPNPPQGGSLVHPTGRAVRAFATTVADERS